MDKETERFSLGGRYAFLNSHFLFENHEKEMAIFDKIIKFNFSGQNCSIFAIFRCLQNLKGYVIFL